MDENVWLLLHGNAIKVHMCLTYQLITVIIESWQRKEQNWAFLTALGNRLTGLPHNRKLLQESGDLFSLYNRNPAKLAAVWCLELCAETLFVLLLKFGAVLSMMFLRLLKLCRLTDLSVSRCVRPWIKFTLKYLNNFLLRDMEFCSYLSDKLDLYVNSDGWRLLLEVT